MTNPMVTQSTIDRTICVKGWTATVRPSESYTHRIKVGQINALSPDADHKISDYELDHVVPLEVGGSPNNPMNLRIQLWPEARAKDAVENRVHDEVCSRRITLKAGQACFLADWHNCP